MKRTASMKYVKSEQSQELLIYAQNNPQLAELQNNMLMILAKKVLSKEGYSKEKAVDVWFNFMNQANILYKKDFGYNFDVTMRFTAAVDMEQESIDLIKEKVEELKAMQKGFKKTTRLDYYKSKKTIGYWSFGLTGLEVKEIIHDVDDYIVGIYNNTSVHKLKVYNNEKGSYVNFNKSKLYMNDCMRVN